MLRSDVNRLKRLAKFLDGFAGSFVREGQSGNAHRYVRGLLSDAKRKNMEGMLQRLSDPGQYQTLQHFITHSTWRAEAIWEQLRAQTPDRRGLLLVDDTSIPKQGRESAGVAHQYCGALGKVANCQVIVTTALRAKRAVWPLSMELFLSKDWCDDEDRRERTHVPEGLQHRTKLQMAIDHIDAARRSGIEITCVLADAGYGDSVEFREALVSRGLAYSVGVSKSTKVFVGEPRFAAPRRARMGRPKTRPLLAAKSPRAVSLDAITKNAPASAWRRIAWRRGTKGPLAAEFLLLRVTPAHRWYRGKTLDQLWLICERTLGKDSVRKFYLSNLPATIDARRLVAITHERWAIEQHYRDLKQETGLDHFEGRSYPGLHRHMALTALAYTFIEAERQRAKADPMLSIGAVREAVTEVVVFMLFALGERFATRAAAFIRDPPKL
ncbi:MAG TPA: IS701 family transposase [Planctomycetota bacterium]